VVAVIGVIWWWVARKRNPGGDDDAPMPIGERDV
jgi:hypothetical protein